MQCIILFYFILIIIFVFIYFIFKNIKLYKADTKTIIAIVKSVIYIYTYDSYTISHFSASSRKF